MIIKLDSEGRLALAQFFTKAALKRIVGYTCENFELGDSLGFSLIFYDKNNKVVKPRKGL